MHIERIICGQLLANCYIVYDDKGNCYIIDPGCDGERIISLIHERQLSIKGVLFTHYHDDHVGAYKQLAQQFKCPAFIHKDDLRFLPNMGQINTFEDGDSFELADFSLNVIHTPGHSMGSVCFFVEKAKVAFTGDTIFDTDLGITDFTGGSPQMMEDSIRNIISKWPDDVNIYPGHDEKATMAIVRKYNNEYLDIVGR